MYTPRATSTDGNSNSNSPTVRSWLAAVSLGLIEYLEKETYISWRYHDSTITPSMGVLGGVRLFKTSSAEFQEQVIVQTWEKKLLTLQLRIVMATNDSVQLECLMADWEEVINLKMHNLASSGINGTFRGVELRRALIGIHPSPRGTIFSSGEIANAQGGVKLYPGQVTAEFVVPYEIDYIERRRNLVLIPVTP